MKSCDQRMKRRDLLSSRNYRLTVVRASTQGGHGEALLCHIAASCGSLATQFLPPALTNQTRKIISTATTNTDLKSEKQACFTHTY